MVHFKIVHNTNPKEGNREAVDSSLIIVMTCPQRMMAIRLVWIGNFILNNRNLANAILSFSLLSLKDLGRIYFLDYLFLHVYCFRTWNMKTIIEKAIDTEFIKSDSFQVVLNDREKAR